MVNLVYEPDFYPRHLQAAHEICDEYQLAGHVGIATFIAQIECSPMYADFLADPDNVSREAPEELRELFAQVKPLARQILERVSVLSDPAAILAYFDADYLLGASNVARGLVSLARGEVRPGPVDRVTAVLPHLMAYIAEVWFEYNDDDFDGPFGPPEDGYPAQPGSGAAFILDVLKAAGWPFDSRQVYEQLPAMRRVFSRVTGGSLPQATSFVSVNSNS